MTFYMLEIAISAISPFAEFAPVGKVHRTDPPRCDGCGEELGSLIRIPPHRYRLKGRNVGDLLTDGSVFAVSKRFKVAYTASSLTGLGFSDDSIELTNSDLLYYMGQPAHTRTLIDEQASGELIDTVYGCDKCRVNSRMKLERIVIKQDTWAGEDVFKLGSLLGLTLVTQRFVDFVKDHDFTNFVFIHQNEYNEDFSFGK